MVKRGAMILVTEQGEKGSAWFNLPQG